MKDVYLINKENGDIVPSEKVFSDFYKTHGILDSVFDYWNETGIEVDGTNIVPPDFTKTVRP